MSVLAGFTGCSKKSAPGTQTPGKDSSGIISGTKAAREDAIAKSTVYIHLPNGNYCTGILLNDHVVLTAAHCLSHGDSGYWVRIPDAYDGSTCNSSESMEISLPPNPTQNDAEDYLPDLGLIRLKKSLCTPAKVVLDSTIRVGDKLKAAGFGFGTIVNRPDYFDMTVISSDMETLKKLYTTQGPQGPVMMEEWPELEPYQKQYAENFIFAMANQDEKSLCNGDSGGPIYHEKNGVLHVVGAVRGALTHSKKGVAACGGAYIQLFTPVGPYVDWIQSKLAIW